MPIEKKNKSELSKNKKRIKLQKKIKDTKETNKK